MLGAWKGLIGVVMILGAVLSAEAQMVCAVTTFPGVLSVGPTKHRLCIVPHPGKYSEFATLLRKGLPEEAVRCCAACMVPAGTRLLITDRGLLTHTVRIVEGPDRGCVGELPKEYVGNCK